MPTSRRSGPSADTSRPATQTCPVAAGSTPAIARSSTVLPAPEGPNSTSVSPGSTASDDAVEHVVLAERDLQVADDQASVRVLGHPFTAPRLRPSTSHRCA